MFNPSRALLVAGMRLGIMDALQLMGPSTTSMSMRMPPIFPKQSYRGGETKGGPQRRTTLHGTNGERECARRRRQIAKGSLRKENGLSHD